MPHIAVKLWQGRSEEVSVSIEEIEPEAWDETVVRPEILEKPDIQYVRSE